MFWAKIVGEPNEYDQTAVFCDDFERAAETVIAQFLEVTAGETKRGAVLVWHGEGDQRVEKLYDWKADFEMPDIIDLEEDEEFDIDGSVELTERIA